MKAVATLLTIGYVSAACECLGTEDNGLPPSSFFTDKSYPADYGSKCSEWDKDAESCQDGGDDFGKTWCTEAWCYVSATNDCDPAAFDTVFFADSEYKDTLKFATSACPKEAEAAADASMALYASAAMATFAAVAASI